MHDAEMDSIMSDHHASANGNDE